MNGGGWVGVDGWGLMGGGGSEGVVDGDGCMHACTFTRACQKSSGGPLARPRPALRRALAPPTGICFPFPSIHPHPSHPPPSPPTHCAARMCMQCVCPCTSKHACMMMSVRARVHMCTGIARTCRGMHAHACARMRAHTRRRVCTTHMHMHARTPPAARTPRARRPPCARPPAARTPRAHVVCARTPDACGCARPRG